MARRRVSNVDIVRYGILGVVGVIVLGVGGYAVLYALGFIGDTSDQSYETLEERELENAPVEVIKFFSYGCPHCASLDPYLEKWSESLPDNVVFRRVHVAFSLNTKVLALTHESLLRRNAIDENHERLFREATTNTNTFGHPERIADFLDGHGIEKDEFLNLYRSERIEALVAQDSALVSDLGITGVPTLLVGNKYLVPPKTSPRIVMGVLDEVVELALNPPDGTESSDPEAESSAEGE